ncbi:MAG: hypothetical protein II237_07805, partial [Clostridia bacterium]|nr:hypothetical protein [Clostridia bacterium]
MKILKKMLAVFLVIIMLLSPTSINLKKDIFVNAVQFHEGNTIIFGSYPQSEVKDRDLITTLNYLAPSWYEWTSYCYYSGDGSIGSMIQGDWMRYVDIEYSNEKYRGVMFTEYRPYYTYKTSTITYQDDNGYNTDTIYWFKFEPLEWIFLDTMSALVMCKTIVDAQPYCNT